MRPEMHPFVQARIAALIRSQERLAKADDTTRIEAHLANEVIAELREIEKLIAFVSEFEAEADTMRGSQ